MAKSFTGIVTSDKADKTITVTVTSRETHPVYGKQYTVSRKYAAHDEKNEAKIGDKVIIVETRPVSKSKAFRLDKIVEQSRGSIELKEEVAMAEPGQASRQLGQRIAGRRHDDAGPAGALQLDARGQGREQTRAQQRRLARPGCAGHHDHARSSQASRQLDDQLSCKPLPTEKHLGIVLVKREQPAIGASGVPARDRGQVLPGVG